MKIELCHQTASFMPMIARSTRKTWNLRYCPGLKFMEMELTQ
jgi:hypothetical protein